MHNRVTAKHGEIDLINKLISKSLSADLSTNFSTLVTSRLLLLLFLLLLREKVSFLCNTVAPGEEWIWVDNKGGNQPLRACCCYHADDCQFSGAGRLVGLIPRLLALLVSRSQTTYSSCFIPRPFHSSRLILRPPHSSRLILRPPTLHVSFSDHPTLHVSFSDHPTLNISFADHPLFTSHSQTTHTFTAIAPWHIILCLPHCKQ